MLRLRSFKDALKDAASPVKLWQRVLGSVSLSEVQVSLNFAPSIMASCQAQEANKPVQSGLGRYDGCCFGSYKARWLGTPVWVVSQGPPEGPPQESCILQVLPRCRKAHALEQGWDD